MYFVSPGGIMLPLHMHAPRGGWITPEITKLTFVRLFTCMGTFMFLQCCLFTKRSSTISADKLCEKKIFIINQIEVCWKYLCCLNWLRIIKPYLPVCHGLWPHGLSTCPWGQIFFHSGHRCKADLLDESGHSLYASKTSHEWNTYSRFLLPQDTRMCIEVADTNNVR